MDGVCPTVARAATEGFDLGTMQTHMLACEQCKPILDAMTAALRGVLVQDDDDLAGAGDDDLQELGGAPSMEALAAWLLGRD